MSNCIHFTTKKSSEKIHTLSNTFNDPSKEWGFKGSTAYRTGTGTGYARDPRQDAWSQAVPGGVGPAVELPQGGRVGCLAPDLRPPRGSAAFCAAGVCHSHLTPLSMQLTQTGRILAFLPLTALYATKPSLRQSRPFTRWWKTRNQISSFHSSNSIHIMQNWLF